MTINLADNDPRVSYAVAAGVTQSSFTVSFEFFADADLNVYVDGTLKTLTTDYTVTGGSGSTGSIAMSVTGASGGSTVVITRSIALERTTDFPSSGPFDISSLNEELDKFISIAGDLKDKSDRALQLTDFDTNVSLTLPDVNTRKGKLLAFNATSGAVEAGASVAGTTTVAGVAADIETLADIEDGTVATDAISDTAAIASDVTSVAGIASNVSTVAGISANVTTVAGNNSNVTTVAGISSNVTTVAGVSANVTTVAGISSDVTTVAGDSTDIASLAAVTSEIGLLGTSAVIADMNLLATSAIITDMDALADLTTEIDALGDVTADVTTVAGIQANVTTVAGVASNVTTVAGISSDVTAVAGISANTTTVAGISSDVTTVAGDSADIQTVAGDSADIATVAGISSDVSAVGAVAANVTTVANNLTNVNNFADTYFVSASAPSSPTTGDLWFDSTNNIMKVYGGSGFQNAGSSVNGTAERSSYTATAGQTTFAATYDAGYVDVYLNGIKLIDGTDFTATSGTSIVLASGAAVNDTVDIVGYGTFELSNFSINDANDVNTSGITNGQVLAYNTSTSDFEPTTITSDLVDDASPQLGADLDTNGNAIAFGTSKWTIELSTDDLIFKYNGVAKIKFASDGEIVTVDDVTAFGTI